MASEMTGEQSRRKEVVDNLNWGSLRDWSQLVRLPTAFTLVSNCIVAAILSTGSIAPLSAFIPALIASLLAYWAGMILNDVVDVEEDREHRPSRPLAADRISPVIAGHTGTGMLLIAPIITLGVTTFHETESLWMGAAFLSSGLLSISVRLYNTFLKRTPLGPMLMGTCRALNIATVGLTMFAISGPEVFPREMFALAGGIWLYIVGVTVIAWKEEGESSPTVLSIGLLFELGGLLVIGSLPRWVSVEPETWFLAPDRGFPLLIALIGITVLRRSFSAIMHPVSRKVQLAVKHALLTLILLDAAVVFTWAGPWYGFAVVLLLVPALTAAVRFRST